MVEEERSDYVYVESGVPQGSVLDLCLFLYYINDLPESLRSRVRLFADDTIVYLTITSVKDSELLQCDLDKLAEWENISKIVFHPGICNIMTVTTKREHVLAHCYLRGHQLTRSYSAKYLGVTITSDLLWKTHINNISVRKPTRLGFLRRNLNLASSKAKTQAYMYLVRPSIEYACTVWDPHTKQDIYRP